MATISVYFNDAASRSKSIELTQTLKNYLFRHDVSFHSPRNLTELEQELRNDIKNKCEYIFSVGGDGTANTIIQSIHGSQTKLIVIPTGTANDFASEMGLNKNIEKIMKVFLHKSYQNIDVIKVNDRFMVSNGGLGMTANVAEKINCDRKRIKGFKKVMQLIGSKMYPIYFAKEFLSPFKMHRLNIYSKDYPLLETIIDASIIMINNQPKIGGNFLIAPQTKNNDGKFNVTLFTHKNKLDLIRTTLKMLQGEYPKDDPELVSFETDELDITALGEDITFFGDGEVLCRGRSFVVKCIPQSLNVSSYNNNLLYCPAMSLDQVELV